MNLAGLATDAAVTIGEIIDLQAALIRKKAERLAADGGAAEKRDAGLALELLKVATERASLAGRHALDSGEYSARANALVEARRLVGGVVIEKA